MPAIPIIPQLNITQDAHESASLEIECSAVFTRDKVRTLNFILSDDTRIIRIDSFSLKKYEQ